MQFREGEISMADFRIMSWLWKCREPEIWVYRPDGVTKCMYAISWKRERERERKDSTMQQSSLQPVGLSVCLSSAAKTQMYPVIIPFFLIIQVPYHIPRSIRAVRSLLNSSIAFT